MNGKDDFDLDALINGDVRPHALIPESRNLSLAMAAAAKLNVVETTFLLGTLQAAMETYRAQLVVACTIDKEKYHKRNDDEGGPYGVTH